MSQLRLLNNVSYCIAKIFFSFLFFRECEILFLFLFSKLLLFIILTVRLFFSHKLFYFRDSWVKKSIDEIYYTTAEKRRKRTGCKHIYWNPDVSYCDLNLTDTPNVVVIERVV